MMVMLFHMLYFSVTCWSWSQRPVSKNSHWKRLLFCYLCCEGNCYGHGGEISIHYSRFWAGNGNIQDELFRWEELRVIWWSRDYSWERAFLMPWSSFSAFNDRNGSCWYPEDNIQFYREMIVHSGGSTMFHGIADRMTKEILELDPSSMKIKSLFDNHSFSYSFWTTHSHNKILFT